MSNDDEIETSRTVKAKMAVGVNSKIELIVDYTNNEIEKAAITQSESNNSVTITLTESEFTRFYKNISQFVFGIGPTNNFRFGPSELDYDEDFPSNLLDLIRLEIFIIFKPTGDCLFHFEPSGLATRTDPGKADAFSMMVNSMVQLAQSFKMKSVSGIATLQGCELLFQNGEKILLVIKTTPEFRLSTADKLFETINSFKTNLIDLFEQTFEEKLMIPPTDENIANFRPDKYLSFKPLLIQLLEKYYLLVKLIYENAILVEAIYYNINPVKCVDLLHRIGEGRSVLNYIIQLKNAFPKLVKVIQKVNTLLYWSVFGLNVNQLIPI